MPRNNSWEQVRILKEVKNLVSEDAKEEMRPIGLHMSYIILQYLKNKKGNNNGTTSKNRI